MSHALNCLELVNAFRTSGWLTCNHFALLLEFFDQEMIESEEVVSLFAFFGQQLPGFGRFQGFVGHGHYKVD